MRSKVAGVARRAWWAGFVFSLLAVLAACGPANTVDVTYHGYSMSLSRSTAHPGPTVFNLNNQDGQVLHQFVIVQTDLPADKLPLGADAKVDETGLKIVGRADNLDVGQTGTLTAFLPPGHYVLMCNIVGHYQLGMHTDFTVAP